MAEWCKNCRELLRETNWYDGPGWTHEHGSSQCRIFASGPDRSAPTRPVEKEPASGVVHTASTCENEHDGGAS